MLMIGNFQGFCLFTFNFELLTLNFFRRVSADTKTCGSPLYVRLLANRVGIIPNFGQKSRES
jgi:hypothetical protein